jgi:serine/threonine protein kinase
VRPLGSGGQADVFLYQQESPSRQVAVKVLNRENCDARILKLFKDEANTMASLSDHPNIIKIYETSITQDGRPYISMEYCETAFSEYDEPLDIATMLKVGVNLSDALYAAHKEGFLHRDIKPSNLMVNRRQIVVLSDFGIASKVNAITLGAMSLKWAAPEVVSRATKGTYTSEVYSAGMTLFALLAGFNPFDKQVEQGINEEKVKSNIMHAKFDLDTKRAGVPDSLYVALDKALSLDASKRYQNMFDFAADLQNVQRELNQDVTPFITPKGYLPQVSDPNATDSGAGDGTGSGSGAPVEVGSGEPLQRYATPTPSGAGANARKYKTTTATTRSITDMKEHEVQKQKLNKVYILVSVLVVAVVVLLGLVILK